MLARLFIVLLLAISLSSVRGWTPLETVSAIELVVVDAEPAPAEGDALASRELALVHQRTTEVARAIPSTANEVMSPDCGRVFRPPRLLGS